MTTKMYSHRDLMENKPDFNSTFPVLAHGDSWGSFGSIVPWATGGLFEHLDFGRDVSMINYAVPGQLLRDLPDPQRFSKFNLAVTLRGMPQWRALLVSGGGNDLIEWVRRGPGNELTHRILRYKNEWLPENFGVARYVSHAGWVNLCQEMLAAYVQFDDLRDKYQPKMQFVTHVYDYMTPRFAPALKGLAGPWLAPEFTAAQIPKSDWPKVSSMLIDLFHDFLTREVQSKIGNFLVLDTRGGTTPAKKGSTGVSNDWANEIHLTPVGYTKLAEKNCNQSLRQLATSW